MKTYMGVDVQLHSLLNLDMGEEQSVSLPGCVNPGDSVPHTHRVGSWMFFKEGLDILPLPGTEPQCHKLQIPGLLKEQNVTNQEN